MLGCGKCLSEPNFLSTFILMIRFSHTLIVILIILSKISTRKLLTIYIKHSIKINVNIFVVNFFCWGFNYKICNFTKLNLLSHK